ncbi:MAG TPA: protein kinase [Vicinamibacterales bacterium]|nr:protein kinase [Vicinamibacterales bacterium]
MLLQPGTSVGSYEIVGVIGAGGMGEVYRARDTKLHREVAIKVLPPTFAGDPDRVGRFEREAQSLAALNHPGIAQVFGVVDLPGGAGSGVAMVMELVEGEDLAQRLARGPIPLEEALPFARQIAEAVEAAHERGIIHRDLKPANIKVRGDGTVKVLDFGLAKAIAPLEGSPGYALENSPTFASPATQMGVLLGTAAYMAPEQAKGKAVDKRTDVWAFGCVLYQMLTGVAPFGGESVSEVIAAVLTRDVDWSSLPADTPSSVRRLLERCLQRDPRRRLRDIGDAILEIDAAAGEPRLPASAGTGRRTRPAWLPLLAMAVIGAAVAATLLVTLRPTPAVPPVRAALLPSAGFVDFSVVAVSPDGSHIAYYRDRAVGGGDLYLRRLDGLNERVIAATVIATHPFFSPGGDEIAYSAVEGRAVMRVPVSGGAPTEVVRVSEMMPGLWLDDGSILVTSAQIDGRIVRALARVPAKGGPAVPLTTLGSGEEIHMSPTPLPGGRQILFTVIGGGGHRLAVADLATGAHRVLSIVGSTPKYLSSGHLLYFEPAVQQMRAVRFDPDRAEPAGEAVVVLTNIHRGIDAVGSFEVSRDGHLFYTAADETEVGRRFGLVWTGAARQTITEERASWAQPRLSPDGRRLLVRETATPNCTVWLYDLERGSRTRILTMDPHDPVWHPDGRRLFFSDLDAAGFRRVFTIRADGTAPRAQVATGFPGSEIPTSVSHDGQWLAVTRSTEKTGSDVWVVPVAGGEARPVAASEYAENYAAFSPDGQWVAYTSNQSGRDEIYVRPWPAADEQYQVSTQGGTGAIWSRDGRRLIYSDGRRVVAVNIATGSTPPERFRAGTPQTFAEGPLLLQRVGNYDLTPDGQRLVVVEGSFNDAQVGRDLRVFFNWAHELRRTVPTR